MDNIKPEFHSSSQFRELEPIPQWSQRLSLDMPHDQFIQVVLNAAGTTQHRYTGTLTHSPENGNVTSFTRTVFRRNKYGPPPTPAECVVGVGYLAEILGATIGPDEQLPGTSRIVLGLYEGQHESGARHDTSGTDHSVEKIAAYLGGEFAVRPGEVLSTRIMDGRATHYSEEIAEIILPTTHKQVVYQLGESIGQERFSVEDFTITGGKAYMVETRHCKKPDPSSYF